MGGTSPDDLIGELDARLGPSEWFPRLAVFMVRSCELVSRAFPARARAALDVGRRYWSEGKATREDLDRASAECWQHLRSTDSENRLDDPDVVALRAVMCVLVAEQRADPAEVAFWFVSLTRRLGAIESEQVALLREVFHEVAVAKSTE